MTTKIIRGAEVTRPEPDALTSTVLDHATVKENAKFGLRNNEGLWPSYNVLDTAIPTPMCPDPLSEKVFGTAGWVPAFEFAIHAGVQCNAVGLDVEDQKSELARVFARNEGKAIEEALLLNRFVAAGSDEVGQWDAPVNTTPTGPVPLRVALALLESYAARTYAGIPTIHMPRAAASLLGQHIIWVGDKAYTRLGSKVAIGGGYDTNVFGQWDLFATGEVYVERSDQIDVHTYVMPGDGSGLGSDENGLSHNTSLALAERMYRVAVDGFVAKATGAVSLSVDGGGAGGSTIVDNGDGTWSVV